MRSETVDQIVMLLLRKKTIYKLTKNRRIATHVQLVGNKNGDVGR